MQLNENVQICLLALASRHPEHTVDVNEAVLGPQSLGAEGWTAEDLLELFQNTNPELLQAPARLVLNQQECSIYLVNRCENIPALHLHCRGNIPTPQGNMHARRQRHQQSYKDSNRVLIPALSTTK